MDSPLKAVAVPFTEYEISQQVVQNISPAFSLMPSLPPFKAAGIGCKVSFQSFVFHFGHV